MQLDFYWFLPTATVIGYNKSRDLFQPIAVTVGEKANEDRTARRKILFTIIEKAISSDRGRASFKFIRP